MLNSTSNLICYIILLIYFMGIIIIVKNLFKLLKLYIFLVIYTLISFVLFAILNVYCYNMGKLCKLWNITNEINMIVLAITFIGVFFAIYSFTNSNIKNSHLSAWNIYVKIFENISLIITENDKTDLKDLSNKLYLQTESLKEFFNDNTVETTQLNLLHIIVAVKRNFNTINILIDIINTNITDLIHFYLGIVKNKNLNHELNISKLIIFPQIEDSFENFINNFEREQKTIRKIITDPLDLNIFNTHVSRIREAECALSTNTLPNFKELERNLLKIILPYDNDEFTNLFNNLQEINNAPIQFTTLLTFFFNHHTALFNIVEIIRTNLNETIKDKSIFHKFN